jgi:hypothetical protein
LSSHSSRSGAASHLKYNPKVSPSWIVERGERALDRISTCFEHILGYSKEDHKCGRFLSGWASPDVGGKMPRKEDVIKEPVKAKR